MIGELLGRGDLAAVAADVTIAAPTRTFDFTYPRRRRFLRWTWTQRVRRRFVVTALPMRELIAVHARMRELEVEKGSPLDLAEACFVVLRTHDAYSFTQEQATAIWEWYQEANQLARPKAQPAETPAAAAPSSISSSISDAGPSTSTTDGSST